MPAPRITPKSSAVGVSTEYLEALKVLSDDTMSKACELLLSDRDFVDSNTGGDTNKSSGTTDLDQLQELYSICCKSAQVIEKEAVAVAAAANQPPCLPMAPAARSMPTTLLPGIARASPGGAGAGVTLVAAKNINNNSNTMMIPNRRIAARLPVQPVNKRTLLEREKSDSSCNSNKRYFKYFLAAFDICR